MVVVNPNERAVDWGLGLPARYFERTEGCQPVANRPQLPLSARATGEDLRTGLGGTSPADVEFGVLSPPDGPRYEGLKPNRGTSAAIRGV